MQTMRSIFFETHCKMQVKSLKGIFVVIKVHSEIHYPENRPILLLIQRIIHIQQKLDYV